METFEYWLGISESIAVIVSLIAIFIQVRQARISTESSSYQSLIDSFAQFQLALAQDETLGHIFFTGRKDATQLSVNDKERFYLICSNYFIFHENLYLQWKRGALPSDVYESWRISIRNNINEPGFKIYWKELQSEYNVEFKAFMNTLIEGK